ncbi:cytokinin dehydrogenase 6-like [Phoenix dactylifera]|uniref:cytokinin dehydrogenase n=1 Tax=Phoenix dactylifera TaxID=42345 RepID=A0A8B9APF3_PHODC|nr:cytokinin dehydrogenase 6-like [Phoenix dactylifera]
MAWLRTGSISSFLIVIFLVITSLMSIVSQIGPWPGALPQDLVAIDLAAKLRLDSHATALVSTDFGGLTQVAPAAVFYPSSPHDIAVLVQFSYSSSRPFTVAPRGHGHSIRGQAFAPDGVVIDMPSLGRGRADRIIVHSDDSSFRYVDAGGEQLWIDVLHAALEHGLSPPSWTDYLYLTVGGTLSNAGVSGQAFRHGPQISNVYELDVITGKGEMVTCSRDYNSELFYAVLGGLGQFGIITRARIALEPAPQRVRWVRLIYDDFGAFTRDQERLIAISASWESKKKGGGFDYVEGSVLAADGSPIGSWRSSSFAGWDAERIARLGAQHGVIYCLEGAMYYDSVRASRSWVVVDEELELLLEELSFVPGFAFTNDVSYERFLDRVHDGELKLRSMGLWDVPHPWLNIFLPKSGIQDFNSGVFKKILKHNESTGPILFYPLNKNKWDERMSSVIPDEEIFYSIGLLWSAIMDDWEYLENLNMEIIQFCDQKGIKYKQYLPHYLSQEDWMKHFGPRWDKFVEMKRKYDPKALLSPGQKIFTTSLVDHATN